ncbi:helix-turn-helix domain-containing protein [Paenibacillus sp. y28]
MKCAADWVLSPQSLPANTILYIHKGRGRLEISGEAYLASPGQVYILTKGQKLEAVTDNTHLLDCYMLEFKVMEPHKTNDNWSFYREASRSFPIQGKIPVTDQARVTRLVEQLHQLAGSAGGQESFQQKHLFYELLYMLAVEHQNQAHHPLQGIERTLAYMKENYMSPISLETLAKIAGFSPSYYSRLFKKTKGIGSAEYMTRLRINRAKELLILSGLSIQDVARSVGYNEESYFSRIFKKETGYSPASYSKKYRQKVAVTRYTYNGDLLALGVTPYASVITEGRVGGPHLTSQLTDAVPIHTENTHYLNELIQIQPDLIVTDSPEYSSDLSAIAPTVILPYWELDWRERFNKIAAVLGKEKEALRWLQQYDDKAAQASRQIRSLIGDATVFILRIVGGKLRVYGVGRNIGSVLYHDLKLAPPREVRNIRWRKTVSIHELPHFDADYILLMTSPKKTDRKLYRKLISSPEWKALTAVRSNQWMQINSYYPWLDYSALSHEMMLDETVRLFVH